MQQAVADARHGSAATAASAEPGSTPGNAAPQVGHPHPASAAAMADPQSDESLAISETSPEQRPGRHRGRFQRLASSARRSTTGSPSPAARGVKRDAIAKDPALSKSRSSSAPRARHESLTKRLSIGTPPTIPKMPARDHSPMPIQDAAPSLGGSSTTSRTGWPRSKRRRVRTTIT